MNPDGRVETSSTPVNRNLPVPVHGREDDVKVGDPPTTEAPRREPAPSREEKPKAEAPRDGAAKPAPKPKEVSEAKLRLQRRLPAMQDDGDIGVEKEYLVTRDGKPDLAFIGTLLASAAPDAARKGHWKEYRIYLTSGGKHVFSRVTRTVYADEDDTYEAEVFDPSPPSVSSQLLRSAREMARSKTLTWMDAAVSFFGYDPLAKALYRKLDVRFEEQIS